MTRVDTRAADAHAEHSGADRLRLAVRIVPTRPVTNLARTEHFREEHEMATQRALIPAPDAEIVKAAPTPMSILQLAIEQGADVERLAKLLELQREWERGEARKAFVKAMNAFKADPPEIHKNKHVKFGQTEYDHATLDHVTDAIAKGLSAHGISHRWAVDQKGGTIKVTCVLTHELGHSEEVSLEGPTDTSGSKNAIQAIGSAVTYLQRYTLLAATGLAPRNGDNDGQTADPKFDGLSEQIEYIQNARNSEELQRLFKNAYAMAARVHDTKALAALIAAKDAKKKEFAA